MRGRVSEPKSRFFTICASNYLAHAIVLGRSVSANHPGARLTVFLLDALPADTSGLEHLDFIAVETIIPATDWHHYQCFYDALELATSIKPACFLHMLAGACDIAIYLDADILLLKPLDLVFSAFSDGHEVVLIPHLLTPLPDDGKRPDDLSIMRTGVYNLGFAAFANTERCLSMLRWWGRHLRTLGLNDRSAGLFTDQKWIDFIPAFVPATSIIRDPGYDVAYWNMHERTVRRTENRWRVTFAGLADCDLTFFHFSGYNPTSADVLSKHENRFRSQPPGDTRDLMAHYADALITAGFPAFAARPVLAPCFDNGAAWDPVCRNLYRSVISADPDFGDPLQGNSFLKIAAGKEVGDHLPRYLRAALKLRPDLALTCDDGRDREGLVIWLLQSGSTQLQIDLALLQHLGINGNARG
jgi:hypothetical protein